MTNRLVGKVSLEVERDMRGDWYACVWIEYQDFSQCRAAARSYDCASSREDIIRRAIAQARLQRREDKR